MDETWACPIVHTLDRLTGTLTVTSVEASNIADFQASVYSSWAAYRVKWSWIESATKASTVTDQHQIRSICKNINTA